MPQAVCVSVCVCVRVCVCVCAWRDTARAGQRQHRPGLLRHLARVHAQHQQLRSHAPRPLRGAHPPLPCRAKARVHTLDVAAGPLKVSGVRVNSLDLVRQLSGRLGISGQQRQSRAKPQRTHLHACVYTLRLSRSTGGHTRACVKDPPCACVKDPPCACVRLCAPPCACVKAHPV